MEKTNNYLNFLNRVYIMSNGKPVTGITKIAKEYNLPYYNYVARFMLTEGLIKRVNDSTYAFITWNTIEPNLSMAKEFDKRFYKFARGTDEKYDLKRTRRVNSIKNQEQKQKSKRGGARPNSGRKTKEVELKETLSNINDKRDIKVSLLWGLIKININ